MRSEWRELKRNTRTTTVDKTSWEGQVSSFTAVLSYLTICRVISLLRRCLVLLLRISITLQIFSNLINSVVSSDVCARIKRSDSRENKREVLSECRSTTDANGPTTCLTVLQSLPFWKKKKNANNFWRDTRTTRTLERISDFYVDKSNGRISLTHRSTYRESRNYLKV